MIRWTPPLTSGGGHNARPQGGTGLSGASLSQGHNMRRALSVLAFGFLVACGDKDEDTGSEDTAADSADTAGE